MKVKKIDIYQKLNITLKILDKLSVNKKIINITTVY